MLGEWREKWGKEGGGGRVVENFKLAEVSSWVFKGDIVNWQVPVLTDNVNHIFVPLLQLALYKSSLLYTTKVWAIRHVLKSNAKKKASIVLFVEGADTNASKVTNSLATQRCGAKSTKSRNIGDAVNWICIWLFTFYGHRLPLRTPSTIVWMFIKKFYFTSAAAAAALFLPLNWTVNLQVYFLVQLPKNILTEIGGRNPTKFFPPWKNSLLNNILLAGFGFFLVKNFLKQSYTF